MTPAVLPQSYSERLQARLSRARAATEELFEIVLPEALYDRPIPERHRIIFYLGHLEAFDWNLLQEPLGLKPFHPDFDKLFAFGIDPVDGGLPGDQPKDWPPIDKIREYNRKLRGELDEKLGAAAAEDPGLAALEQGRLIEVAIEHRLMHAETLCYMFHQLPVERKRARAILPAIPAPPRVSRRIEIPAGMAMLGLPREDNSSFGWDNEFEAHRVDVPAFAIDEFNVTNRDYLRFVQQGGYRERALWSDSGWEWITSQGREHPAFWVRRGDRWSYRAMFEEIPLPPAWPVYVSHQEATAYARWLGKQLPSEAEWHRASCATRAGEQRPYPWGAEPPAAHHGNFDMRRWDPVPVGSFPAGSSGFGVADLAGNGWEWTRTPFAPFPGFKAFPFYPGYSANFFDGKHFVMKGGSARTAACMVRRTFRNWFQPNYPYIYAAFRCVEN